VSDPFYLLPNNLGDLARICAAETARSALSGVHLSVADGTYRACATDGRRLGLVTGPVGEGALDYPAIPELIAAPPSEPAAVIPLREWRQAFRSAPRGKAVADAPLLAHVAVHLGKVWSILASTDGATPNVSVVANLEGRFPPYDVVLPKGEPEPTARLFVNPELLDDVLLLAQQFCDAEAPRATVELYGPKRPVAVRASNGRQHFLGLVMPLS
jgi:hypothetical protein